MQIGVKFSTAIHILLSVEFFKDEKNTSEFLAQTIGTNPVIVRNIIALLKSAGLIQVARGIGGVTLSKEPKDITLYQIYTAINDKQNLFKIHQNAPAACPLGGRIDALLEPKFQNAQKALEQNLNSTSLQNLLDELKN
ncbi:Rrf2 family transcriptional regulator [Campylobacter mucosalis]|uniref:Rrf2 family transcriptional regulator n=1 Tax=Campylobacter mucosalis TaxID=202 RepID=UPI00147060DC|nr:Rrf2 family transcriptional regulator [Campylobacter mucosalis]